MSTEAKPQPVPEAEAEAPTAMETTTEDVTAPQLTPKGRTVKLQMPDGEIVVSRELVKNAKLIQNMLIEDEDDEEQIPLPTVNKATMELCVQFWTHHLTHPAVKFEIPIKSPDINVVLGPDFKWDAEFITAIMPYEQLFDLILAAQYVDDENLLDLACLRVATILKNRTPKEIRQEFGIPDPSPEEEDKIRKDNAWVFDIRPVDPDHNAQSCS